MSKRHPLQKTQLLKAQRFNVVQLTHVTSRGNTVVREVVEHPGAVVILPLVDDDHVCLIRNYRAAVDQTLWELPAGTLEPGEPPLETAYRELEEETGYRAETIEELAQFWMSPGILSERMHLYVARRLTAGPMHLEQNEEIETRVIAWSEAMQMLQRGEIQDAKTLVGLMWHDRSRV